MNGTFNAAAGSTYKITATSNLPGDPVVSNNQATEMVLISQPPAATDLTAYYCDNSKQYELSGNADGELLWYQNSTGNIPVAAGSLTSTTQKPVNNTFYAGVNDFTGSVGPAAKSAFTGGGYDQYTPYVTVNTSIPMVIESARLYIGNSGKIAFNVANTNGEIVSATTISVVATTANPQLGTKADDPNDPGAVYNLNLLLPSAGTYTITPVFDSTATIYRSNAGVKGYPFSAGNVFSITGNNASSGSDTSSYKGFYYYFYDMQLKSAGCASVSRQAVTVTKPVITQNGSVLSSNFLSGNQWYLDGSPIKGAINSTYTPVQSGNYHVAVNVPGGCQLLSDTLAYISLNSNTGNNSNIGLVLFPVPASNELNIIFAAQTGGSLSLSLINAAGQTVYTRQQNVTAGNFGTVINVANQPPGTYVLKLLLGQKAYKAKVIILR